MKALLLFLLPILAFGQITNINLGTSPNDGTGDTVRIAFGKVNTNTAWLASQLGSSTNASTTLSNAVFYNGGILGVPSFTAAVASLTEPAAYQIFQRTNSGSGLVWVTGIATGPTGTSVEARHNGGSWQAVGTSDRYGAFSGTITASVGNGNLEARIVGGSSSTTVSNVAVGDVFAIWGQSNGSGRLVSNQSFTNTTTAARMLGNDYVWKTIADPTDSNTGQIDTVSSDSDAQMGSVWPLVADTWVGTTSIPIGFIQATKGSTGFSGSPSWVPGSDYFDRSTLFGSAMYRIRVAHGVRAILWWQGEGGFDDTTGMSYITPFTNMVTAVQSQFSGLKLVPFKLQECVGITTPRLTNGWYAVGRLWSEFTNLVFTGPTLADAPVGAASNILTEDEGQGTPYYHIKTSTNAAVASSRIATNLISNFQTY